MRKRTVRPLGGGSHVLPWPFRWTVAVGRILGHVPLTQLWGLEAPPRFSWWSWITLYSVCFNTMNFSLRIIEFHGQLSYNLTAWDQATITAELGPPFITYMGYLVLAVVSLLQGETLATCLHQVLNVSLSSAPLLPKDVTHHLLAALPWVWYALVSSARDCMFALLWPPSFHVKTTALLYSPGFVIYPSVAWPLALYVQLAVFQTRQFRLVNERIRNFVSEALVGFREPSAEQLEDLRLEHRRLAELNSELNRLMSLYHLVNFFVFFAHTSFTSYSLLVNLVFVNAFFTVFGMFEFVFLASYLLIIVAVCCIACNTGNEYRKVGQELTRLPRAKATPALRDQILAFQMQLDARTPTPSAGGLFNVSKPLLVAMLGTILSYLIILVQFYATNNEEHSYGYYII